MTLPTRPDEYERILRITLDDGPTAEHPGIQFSLTVNAEDMTVHGWFDLFERVLAMASFDERVIMDGACRLAFHEGRRIEMMREVAREYDLTLKEDASD